METEGDPRDSVGDSFDFVLREMGHIGDYERLRRVWIRFAFPKVISASN